MAVKKPEIKWIGTNGINFTRGRERAGKLYLPEAGVVHIAEGSIGAVDSWFSDPRANASTHFCVPKAKAEPIHQYVDIRDTAWANGLIEAGYTATLIDANGGVNPNLWTTSQEHEGFSGEAMTTSMFEKSTDLMAWLFDSEFLVNGATDVAPDWEHILGHYRISPKSRPRCPGYSVSFLNDYINAVQVKITGSNAGTKSVRDALDAITVQIDALMQDAWDHDQKSAAKRIQAANLQKVLESYK